MAEGWVEVLEKLQKRDVTPLRWSILRLEVRHTYWNMLAYEHDGLTETAETAKRECAACAEKLRQFFDPIPGLGPEAADACIAEEVNEARREFANDLRREQRSQERMRDPDWAALPLPAFLRTPYEWRSRRGQARGYQSRP